MRTRSRCNGNITLRKVKYTFRFSRGFIHGLLENPRFPLIAKPPTKNEVSRAVEHQDDTPDSVVKPNATPRFWNRVPSIGILSDMPYVSDTTRRNSDLDLRVRSGPHGRLGLPVRLGPRTRHTLRTLCLALSMAVLAGTARASAQYRFGVSLGGTGFVAVVAEYRWSHQGLELQAGTWRFRDLSLALTGKQYVGSYAVQPYTGLGFWGIVAGSGFGLIARFPIGLDWNIVSGHTAGAALYFNRALLVKRPDPEDRRPPRGAFIPLPEVSYRWDPGD